MLASATVSALLLVHLFLAHKWVMRADGSLIPTDFLSVYAAGLSVWVGKAAMAYDWAWHDLAQSKITGPLKTFLAWLYPPPFLFVAAGLFVLPYLAAWVAWMVLSAGLCAWALRPLLGWRFALLLTLAFPPAIITMKFGQNGFFTTALLAFFVTRLQAQPARAGVALGLLTYKPQLGLLMPLVLVLEKRWRVIATASAVALALVGISVLAFGVESWRQFFHWLPAANAAFLNEGAANLHKMQSLFAFARMHGVAYGPAMAAHGLFLAVLLGWTVWLRRRGDDAMGTAALGLMVVLTSPYLYVYDAMAAVVPFAIYLRSLLRDGGRWSEHAALGGIWALMLWQVFMGGQGVFLALLALAVLISWRACQSSQR
jgi:hypothetical protein